jgi:prophage regulatory protein
MVTMEKHEAERGDRFCRLPDVLNQISLCRAQVYAMVKADEFPRPYRLSQRAVAWKQSDLSEWLDSREFAIDLDEAS